MKTFINRLSDKLTTAIYECLLMEWKRYKNIIDCIVVTLPPNGKENTRTWRIGQSIPL
jgi:hypothetical protein